MFRLNARSFVDVRDRTRSRTSTQPSDVGYDGFILREFKFLQENLKLLRDCQRDGQVGCLCLTYIDHDACQNGVP